MHQLGTEMVHEDLASTQGDELIKRHGYKPMAFIEQYGPMNPPTQSLYHLLIRLWRHFPVQRRRQFWYLLILMTVASLTEILTIGAVFPFLGVLTSPVRVFEHPAFHPVIQFFNLTSPNEILLPVTVAFALIAVLSGLIRVSLLWVNTEVSYSTGTELSIDIYRRTLFQPYAIHIQRNSSEVINGIFSKSSNVTHLINSTAVLISSIFMLSGILVALLVASPITAISAFGGFGLIYILLMKLARRRLLLDSQRSADESTRVIKSLQEGLGGIRDILLDGSQSLHCQVFNNANSLLRSAQANNILISQSPRYGMESLGMVLVASLAYALAKQEDGIATAIPFLGALAISAQRLLPLLQQTFVAWSALKGGQVSLLDTIVLLDQPIPAYASEPAPSPIAFHSNITLRQVSFKYSPHGMEVLNHLDLTIKKGSRVGFVGATGSGKSTLIDIVMGLLDPTEGVLAVDGEVITMNNYRAWQAHIAHVPQQIFLTDASIAENIAFGVSQSEVDFSRVESAAAKAQLKDLIESWPEKYQTSVGERGVRLSGGQRQRIGIARALYKKADVIIFDEATSALDTETEQSVMNAIDGLNGDLTILIIAHRLSTLKNCDEIVEISNGRAIKSIQ